MQFILICIWASLLILLSVVDLKWKKVPIYLILTTYICAFTNILFQVEWVWYYQLGGILLGLIFMLMSWLTRQAIGYADSLLILACGIGLGLWPTIQIMMLAFFLSGFVAMIKMIQSKMKRKDTFAFIPCITIAYILVMIVQPRM